MTQSRTGSLTAATWLIGVGVVFLIQRAADLSWSEAWPLFVILGGCREPGHHQSSTAASTCRGSGD